MGDTQPSLENLPTPTMSLLFEYLDIESIFNLRKASVKLNDKVNEFKPDLKMKSILVTIDTDSSVEIRLVIRGEPNFCRLYNHQDNGARNLTDFANDFGYITSFKIPRSIYFSLDSCKEAEDVYPIVINGIVNSLAAHQTILPVDNMTMQVFNVDDVGRIWNHTDPKLLKTLDLKHPRGRQVLDVSNIALQPHWTNISTLFAQSCVFTGPSHLLTNFKLAHFQISQMTSAIVKTILKAFVTIEIENCSYHIGFDNFVDREEVATKFGNHPSAGWNSISGSQNTGCLFKVYIYNNSIIFDAHPQRQFSRIKPEKIFAIDDLV